MRVSGICSGALAAVLVAGLVWVPAALGAPPPNDDLANAQVLSGETGTVGGTNVEATKELGEPDHAGNPGGASVWFKWTAPRSGVLIVDTCDSDFDTLLAVYTGDSFPLTEIRANDDDGLCGPQSGVEVGVVAGTEYRIAVDGKGGATGAITLFYGMAPPNDDFAAAAAITGASGSVDGSTFLASYELDEPLHAGEPGTGSVWYRWVAPGDGRAILHTCDSTGDTLLAVYTGSAVASLSNVAANDNWCGSRSRVQFDATAGTVYSIAVDGFEGVESVRLDWFWQHHPPRNLSPPTITGAAVEHGTLVGSVGQW